MTQDFPGSSWKNPIWYRGYRIYLSSVIDGYDFVHDDYDGADDANDYRYGYGSSVLDCKEAIDELEDIDKQESIGKMVVYGLASVLLLLALAAFRVS